MIANQDNEAINDDVPYEMNQSIFASLCWSIYDTIESNRPTGSLLNYTLTQEEEDMMSEDTANYYVSLSINNTEFTFPIPIDKVNFYKNLVELIDERYGYKTGRKMGLYQPERLTEKDDLKFNNYPFVDFTKRQDDSSRIHPQIAFISVKFTDARRYKIWYEKHGFKYSKEAIMARYPLRVFGKVFDKINLQ